MSSQYGPPPDLAEVAHEPRVIVRRKCWRCGWVERRPVPPLRGRDRVILSDREDRADYVLVYACAACVNRGADA